jgi:hypothetical protein
MAAPAIGAELEKGMMDLSLTSDTKEVEAIEVTKDVVVSQGPTRMPAAWLKLREKVCQTEKDLDSTCGSEMVSLKDPNNVNTPSEGLALIVRSMVDGEGAPRVVDKPFSLGTSGSVHIATWLGQFVALQRRKYQETMSPPFLDNPEQESDSDGDDDLIRIDSEYDDETARRAQELTKRGNFLDLKPFYEGDEDDFEDNGAFPRSFLNAIALAALLRRVEPLVDPIHPSINVPFGLLKRGRRLFPFSPLAEGAVVLDKIPWGSVSHEKKRFVSQQLVSALLELHVRFQMAHGDFGAWNILVHPETFQVSIIDYDRSMWVHSNSVLNRVRSSVLEERASLSKVGGGGGGGGGWSSVFGEGSGEEKSSHEDPDAIDGPLGDALWTMTRLGGTSQMFSPPEDHLLLERRVCVSKSDAYSLGIILLLIWNNGESFIPDELDEDITIEGMVRFWEAKGGPIPAALVQESSLWQDHVAKRKNRLKKKNKKRTRRPDLPGILKRTDTYLDSVRRSSKLFWDKVASKVSDDSIFEMIRGLCHFDLSKRWTVQQAAGAFGVPTPRFIMDEPKVKRMYENRHAVWSKFVEDHPTAIHKVFEFMRDKAASMNAVHPGIEPLAKCLFVNTIEKWFPGVKLISSVAVVCLILASSFFQLEVPVCEWLEDGERVSSARIWDISHQVMALANFDIAGVFFSTKAFRSIMNGEKDLRSLGGREFAGDFVEDCGSSSE